MRPAARGAVVLGLSWPARPFGRMWVLSSEVETLPGDLGTGQSSGGAVRR